MDKNKKLLILVLGIVVLGGLGFYFFQGNDGSPTLTVTPFVTVTLTPGAIATFSPTLIGDESTPTPSPSTTSMRTPTPTPTPTPAAMIHTVSYTSSGYSPSVVTIRAGDTVKFVNNSSNNMWPASDPHPTHTNYPEFDPMTSISPGGQWSFTFSKPGTWGYHDHLTPGKTGTVIVQ